MTRFKVKDQVQLKRNQFVITKVRDNFGNGHVEYDADGVNTKDWTLHEEDLEDFVRPTPFHKLKDLETTLSGVDARYELVYANGKRATKTQREFTELERNTTVLNIFAIGVELFQVHLVKLGD